ncbi:zinc-binding dehydrogenase [Streptomyces rochei]
MPLRRTLYALRSVRGTSAPGRSRSTSAAIASAVARGFGHSRRACAIADHPVVDDGHLTEKFRALVPQGVDASLELVGCSVLAGTLRTVRRHGTVCFTGSAGGAVVGPRLLPVRDSRRGATDQLRGPGHRPAGGRLRPPAPAIAEGRLRFPVAKVYRGLEEVREAHADIESGTILG